MFLNVIPRVCTTCKQDIKGGMSGQLIYCKKCASVECLQCSRNDFAKSVKLTHCPQCATADWPYEGKPEDANAFFMALWRRMAECLSYRNAQESKPFTALIRLCEQIS